MLAVALATVATAGAQNSKTEARTPVVSLNIVKQVKPPLLAVEGQVIFNEPSGNRAIDAGERCTLRMTVKNNGMGDGIGLRGTIRLVQAAPGITVAAVALPTLKVGATTVVDFPIEADLTTADGTADFLLGISEPNGFNLPEIKVSVPTRAFDAPMVEYLGSKIAEGGQTISTNTPYTLQVLVQNTGQGDAERVEVRIVLPQGVYQLGEEGGLHGVALRSGEHRTIDYKFIVPESYSQSQLDVGIEVKERYSRYSKGGRTSFAVRRQQADAGVVVAAMPQQRSEVVKASIGSDVDRDIPRTSVANSTLHVMIIANQNYFDEKPVGTALNDGRMVSEYCRRTLGVPEGNLKIRENRTAAQMQGDIDDFARDMRYNPGHRFLFFYFGHGMCDQDREVADAYLMPIDGSSLRLRQTGVSRNQMMSSFGQAGAEQVVVVLESCFSGATATDEMLSYSEHSSGLRMEDDVSTTFGGNVILLTASSKAETANAFPSQGHNVFTYELLRALKETRGQTDWGSLFARISEQTKLTAWRELGRDQHPSCATSISIGDQWKQWRLIDTK